MSKRVAKLMKLTLSFLTLSLQTHSIPRKGAASHPHGLWTDVGAEMLRNEVAFPVSQCRPVPGRGFSLPRLLKGLHPRTSELTKTVYSMPTGTMGWTSLCADILKDCFMLNTNAKWLLGQYKLMRIGVPRTYHLALWELPWTGQRNHWGPCVSFNTCPHSEVTSPTTHFRGGL